MYDILGLNRLLHWIQISVKSIIKSNQGYSSKYILGKDTYLLLLIQLWHNKKNPRISKVFQLYKVVVIVLLLPGHQNPPDLYGIWDSFVLPDLEKNAKNLYLCIYFSIFFYSSNNSLLDKAPNNNLVGCVIQKRSHTIKGFLVSPFFFRFYGIKNGSSDQEISEGADNKAESSNVLLLHNLIELGGSLFHWPSSYLKPASLVPDIIC